MTFVTPPGYDPGGYAALIDDFAVDDDVLWPSTGMAPLRRPRQRLAARGVVQVVVVTAHGDEPKRLALQAAGLYLASEWYVDNVGKEQ